MLIDRFFVHHKLKNILSTKHVTITTFPNHIWLVVMEKYGQNFYMTTEWNRIKEDMQIQDEHFIVFDMIFESKFDMMLFKGIEALICILERRLAHVKEEVNEEVAA
ncbi:putative DNA-binding pseudobarrel domain superfamily [Helianthus anomalus]